MEKISGRFYVSMLILSAIDRSYLQTMSGNSWMWAFVVAHVGCLFFVVKDGVK